MLHQSSIPLWLIQAVMAYEWGKGGLTKILGGQFPSTLEKTLGTFAAKNPYGWYAKSVLSFAQNHAELFGQLVQWGELIVGIGLIATLALSWKGSHRIAAGLAIASLCMGIVMNIQFYLAAGWMSPSTHGLNLVMTWVQVALVIAWAQTLRKGAVPFGCCSC